MFPDKAHAGHNAVVKFHGFAEHRKVRAGHAAFRSDQLGESAFIHHAYGPIAGIGIEEVHVLNGFPSLFHALTP